MKPSSACIFASNNSLQRAGGGAFVEYSQPKSSMGSVQSLPGRRSIENINSKLYTNDIPGSIQKSTGALPQQSWPVTKEGQDHTLAVDALVAELELNTDTVCAIFVINSVRSQLTIF